MNKQTTNEQIPNTAGSPETGGWPLIVEMERFKNASLFQNVSGNWFNNCECRKSSRFNE